MKSSIIGFLYRNLLKPVLFQFNPEKVHELFTITGAILAKYTLTKKITKRMFFYKNIQLKQRLAGSVFTNPVGLSAGFDKDIVLPEIMGDVGFGWEEAGSITANPYEGNAGKRAVRLKKSKGLLIYYGLKNKGVDILKPIIASLKPEIPLFISIAKTNSKETCEYQAGINDYIYSLRELQNTKNIAGFVINISCPNAFGGEDYTSPERLEGLLQEIQKIENDKPIFVKLPVDLSIEKLEELVYICIQYNITGVSLANLIKQRDTITEEDREAIKDLSGGISGKPMQQKVDYLIGEIYKKYGDKILIIGIGGIFSAEDAYHKIKQGASLVQLITGMIYQGPQLIGDINRGLIKFLEKDGYTHISQAIGANHKK